MELCETCALLFRKGDWLSASGDSTVSNQSDAQKQLPSQQARSLL